MTHVAFTGHRGLPDDVVPLVDSAVRQVLVQYNGELLGITSLADGADTHFARAVLDADGRLRAVIPATNYREALPAEHRPVLDDLLARATDVVHLDSTSESHMAAAQRMLDDADELIAVWDGKPARGYGGTADIVTEARRRQVPVQVVAARSTTRLTRSAVVLDNLVERLTRHLDVLLAEARSNLVPSVIREPTLLGLGC